MQWLTLIIDVVIIIWLLGLSYQVWLLKDPWPQPSPPPPPPPPPPRRRDPERG